MLRKALNVHWKSHVTNVELYGELPIVCNKIASRRLKLAGHCHRDPELITQRLVLWEPKHGYQVRGRPINNYIDTMKRDTGARNTNELATLMEDRDIWRVHVKSRLRLT